jgi:hypothetical protein
LFPGRSWNVHPCHSDPPNNPDHRNACPNPVHIFPHPCSCSDGSSWTAQFGVKNSTIELKEIADIKAELLTHGPVSTQFKVYVP